jgi:4'-phosphopantetheinyl transferase
LKNNCHIWDIDINQKSYDTSLNYINLLSNKEKEKFNSFRFQEDKSRFIISHVALRKIITYYTHIPASLIKFEYNKYNKVYLANKIPKHLFFNLSHAHNKAVIAINNTEVGIDIEYVENLADIYELASIIFSSHEYDDFLQLSCSKEKLNYFYTIWTKKEAYLKALSIGLIDDLKSVHVGAETNSKIDNQFILQKIHINCSGYISNVALKGSQYKNILYCYY